MQRSSSRKAHTISFRNIFGAYSLGATSVRGFGDQVNIYSIGPKVNPDDSAPQQKQPEVVV